MTVPRLYLDTNIFIYAFENNDERAKTLLHLIELSSGQKHSFLATSEMTLAELLVEPLRRADERLVLIYDNICVGNALMQVGTVSREVLWFAALLRAENRHLRLPDAIHLSTAMLFGCSRFLTADTALRDRYALRPNAMSPHALSADIAVVRPDLETLQAMIEEAAV